MAWSDYGVSKSLDGFKLNTQYKEGSLECGYKEAIIKAINERCDIVGVDRPYSGLPRLHSTKNYFDDVFFISGVNETLEFKINELIPLFVNHTDNSGNWDGQSSIPNWTKNDMLTYIGEVEIQYKSLDANISEWAFQQYKLLNLMRSQKIIPETSTDNGGVKIAFGETWNDAVVNFNALNYTIGEQSSNVHIARRIAEDEYRIERRYQSLLYTNSYNHSIKVDYYPWFYDGGFIPDAIYENNDYQASENTFFFIDSTILNQNGNYNFVFGDIKNNTMPEPTKLNNFYAWRSLDNFNSKYVIWHNITNGFEFQDNTI